MNVYAIYAGLGGGFGGRSYKCCEKYSDEDAALEVAREWAIDEYKSYDGMHGLKTIEDCDEDEEEYQDEMESWLDCDAVEVTLENYDQLMNEEDLDSDESCRIFNMLLV